eukprot:c14596_g1_i1.p1 GENE.c14596_g1_i1~~c14596_g1_i1.p1  ORF type:complete len:472 (+),score=178.04 c14596_g1_i1:24-1439(+)
MISVLLSASLDPTALYDICYQIYRDNPWHFLVEGICVAVIIYLLTQKSSSKDIVLTEEEVDLMVHEWKPEPLVPQNYVSHPPLVVEGTAGPKIQVGDRKLLNFAYNDFLGLIGDERVQTKIVKAIDDYGCGSCGPRGFYGTIDVHVQLEEKIAQFMKTPKAIIYSSDVVTLPSVLPPFSKSGDVILCDDGAGFSVQEACKMSRSEIILFKHGDMADLEDKLKKIVAKDQAGKKKKLNRRYIVTEAISQNYGDIAPIVKLVELKHKYKFRLVVDESYSIGVLGRTGRGISEEFGIDISEIDILTGSLGNSLSSLGGFCCGSAHLVDHQRLSGSGYVFSASAPPYLSIAAIETLEILQNEPERLQELRKKSDQLRKGLQAVVNSYHFVKLHGSPGSPILVLAFPQDPQSGNLSEKMVAQLLELGAVVAPLRSSPAERRPVHGIRIHVTRAHTTEDIEQLIGFVSKALAKVLTK